jgi:hypothetical protein
MAEPQKRQLLTGTQMVITSKTQEGTNVNQPTIHWMPVITQLWMNLNRVTIYFHLGNQFYKK